MFWNLNIKPTHRKEGIMMITVWLAFITLTDN